MIRIVTDIHLSDKNAPLTVALMKEVMCKELYVMGDVFESRKGQSLDVLEAWMEILDYYQENGCKIYAIPGNHDKKLNEDVNSYLDIYSKHPAMTLFTEWGLVEESFANIYMIPFFCEKTTYRTYLNKCKKNMVDNGKPNILLTHIAVNGVANNDGSKIDGAVDSSDLLDVFNKVLIGHYHNRQTLCDGKIVYVGSIKQKNFGEDIYKGVTILHDDLKLTQERLESAPTYRTEKIDLSKISNQELLKLGQKEKGGEENVRYKLIGSKDQIKGIDIKALNKIGIDIKTDETDIDVDLSYVGKTNFEGYTVKNIKEVEFPEFCENGGYDGEYLTKKMKQIWE